MIDFTQLGINSIQKQINPRDIFMALTGKDNKYQYPRDVQGEVWKQWFNVRQNKDTIIKMNTGSGKTLVALLILQSCLNEGVGPALYVVPDKFLVEQVKTQADALGIKVTDTENDLDYQRKKAILVIGIQKLVNGKSIFGLREENNYPIGSVVIDDMHACISCIQEQFSITVPRTNVLYNLIANLFYDDMNAQAEGRFNEIVNSQNTFDNMMVPFWSWQEKITQVYQILASNRENDAVKFKFDLIKDCLKLSHCYISAKEISIIPNCTPIQKITSFAHPKESRSFVASAVSFTISPQRRTASMLIPVLVEPTLTELHTLSVLASACGIERIRFSSLFVIPLETSAEYPPIKLTPTSLAALSSVSAMVTKSSGHLHAAPPIRAIGVIEIRLFTIGIPNSLSICFPVDTRSFAVTVIFS